MDALQPAPGLPAEDQELTFGGTIDRVIYQNAENGYAVLCVVPDAKHAGRGGFPKDKLTCTGTLPNPQGGMKIAFTGRWVETRKFGRQFAFTGYEEQIPTSEAGLIAYLSSGLIKGVGADLAKRIVKAFGQDTVRVLDTQPDSLLKVKGIGKKNIEMIKESWTEHRCMSDLMQALQPYGISPAYGLRIFAEYGPESLEVVRANPYRLAMDIRGIGFVIADKIAMKLGVEGDAPLRVQAGCLYVLQQASESGDVYMPQSRLIEQAKKTLGVGAEAILDALRQLAEEERVCIEDLGCACPAQEEGDGDSDDAEDGDGEHAAPATEKAVYLKIYYTCECKTGFYLARLMRMPMSVAFTDRVDQVAKAVNRQPFRLSPEQVGAVALASRSKVMVLTGGPGTGKTTIIKAIISLFLSATSRKRIFLAAPTGRAAKRMSEATDMKAKTLHRLLEYNPQTHGFSRNEDTPLECDLLIVDEASMMDIVIFYYLLKAVPSGACVIFVGDIFQLPSVGPGAVLQDIIDSKALPVAMLSQIFRQTDASDIALMAHQIKEGQLPRLQNPRDGKTDFYFMRQDEPEDASRLIVDLVKRRLPAHYGWDPLADIQVLTPMHQGIVGAENLNRLLQEALNPNGLEIARGERRFRVGDKVMQTRNNYDKDVFNGDIGIVVQARVDVKELVVDFDGEEKTYMAAELDELVPAYAISIHKSQGSEYPCVVIPIMTTNFVMLKRNLLYTGITRGKKLVVVVGQPRAVEIAVARNETSARCTRLAERLSGCAPCG
jgi:exodeoxyribonuclease V alpha subunit